MKRLIALIGLAASMAHAQVITNFVPGQVLTAAQLTSAFNHAAATTNAVMTNPTIAGGTITGATITGLSLGSLAAQAANTVVANVTGSSASPTAFAMPSCSTSSSALTYTSGTGFTCNTAVNAAQLGGATFSAPGPIGSGTASTGAFTTLSATSTVSGAGFTTLLGPYALLASPIFTGTPAAPTAALGTNTTQIATTSFALANTISTTQTFTNETGSRVSGTTYTNSTGRPIVIYVLATASAAPGGLACSIASIQVGAIVAPSIGQGISQSLVIPAGSTYSCTVTSASLTTWYELR